MNDYEDLDMELLEEKQHLLFRASNREDSLNLLKKFVTYLKAKTNCTIVDVQPIKGRISIEAIRELKPLLKLDTTNSNVVITFADAHTMAPEAQSALLKVLEEVSLSTRLLFAGDFSKPLLPTILSRLQIVNFVPPQLDEVNEAKQSLYRASGYSLATLETFDSAENSVVKEAKVWLSSPAIKRLSINQKYNESDKAIELAKTVQLLLYGAVLSKLGSENRLSLTAWLNKLESVGETLTNLQLGGNVRLNLVNLALKI